MLWGAVIARRYPKSIGETFVGRREWLARETGQKREGDRHGAKGAVAAVTRFNGRRWRYAGNSAEGAANIARFAQISPLNRITLEKFWVFVFPVLDTAELLVKIAEGVALGTCLGRGALRCKAAVRTVHHSW